MAALGALKSALTRGDLARLLAFTPQGLSYVLYKLPDHKKYTSFEIRKRTGGVRVIDAPTEQLKLIQRRLATLLQDCVDEINTLTNRKDQLAHGFKRKRSIITNAVRHRNRRYVFNVDLEDFFPSINFGRIRGFLISNRDFGLSREVATVIAQIACRGNALPQGAPSSPVLSNLVAQVLDVRLVTLARAMRCTYSRYADDITFSTNIKEFPSAIAVSAGFGDTRHEWSPGPQLEEEIRRSGFRLNKMKTQMMYNDSRQKVTGLVVNDKIAVPSQYRRRVRAMVHRLTRTGSFDVVVDERLENVTRTRAGSPDELHGMLGFVHSVDHYGSTRTVKRPKGAHSSREVVYRQFLLYRNFYAAPTPVIVCEGETDNVYLTQAIRRLAKDYPLLAETAGSKITLKVRLYKYPQSSTADLLGLRDGGSADLTKFMAVYKHVVESFKPAAASNPVIVLYDDDDGAKPIRSTIKTLKRGVTVFEPFVRVCHNLYAVPVTAVPATAPCSIENCFDDATKQILIDGKKFNAAKAINRETDYGKKVFAHKVVRPRADTIDFSGFRPLLDRLVTVIQHHGEVVTESGQETVKEAGNGIEIVI